jgi:lipoyl(octanoyl) transferase
VTPGALLLTPRIAYLEAWAAQERLADARRAGAIPDVVWILEHDPVYTYGRHGRRADLHLDDAELSARGGACHRVDRGGQMTWHGPGQSVGYVIRDLRGGRRVRGFVRSLTEAMAEASGVPGATTGADAMGCYVDGRKLGSVGIRVDRGVTTHGLALNRDPDATWLLAMTACGAPDVPPTTIEAEGCDPDRTRVDEALAGALADRLRLDLRPAALLDLLSVRRAA